MAEEMQELPRETKVNPIITDVILFDEILPKLPLKSLMRFKCVSQQWKSIIISHDFAKLLLQLSNSEPHNHGVLIQTNSSLYAIPNYACFNGNESFDFEPLKMRLDHHSLCNWSFHPLDSCNGLICFLSNQERDMCVWNPFTEECRKIPGFQKLECVMFAPSLWAFGYIPFLDDYKILYACLATNLYPRQKGITLIKVFSLRNNLWQEFDTIGPLGMCSQTPQNCGIVLVNGKCNWLVLKIIPVFSASIVVFDLVSNTFDLMPLPEVLNGDDKKDLCKNSCIGRIEEDLCVVFRGFDQMLEVWVMESYGEGGSWTKLLKVSDVIPVTLDIKFCTLCKFGNGGNSGKLLMQLNEEVWVYYWSDSSLKCVQIEGVHTRHTRQFVQSLISPFMSIF